MQLNQYFDTLLRSAFARSVTNDDPSNSPDEWKYQQKYQDVDKRLAFCSSDFCHTDRSGAHHFICTIVQRPAPEISNEKAVVLLYMKRSIIT